MNDTTKFDTIVIGSGTSAYFCITHLNKAGKNVAVVDERPYGGTCALRGCQPKKYLVAHAEAIAMARQLEGKGIVGKTTTDWPALQRLKAEFLDGRSENEKADYEAEGVTTFSGRAQFASPTAVDVNGRRLTAETIVLATGAKPRISDIPGKQHVRDSEYFLDLKELPKKIVFVGGGYISFEFANVAALAGSEVTIIHRSSRLLKAFDADMVAVAVEATKDLGVNVVTDESPVAITQNDHGYVIEGSSGSQYYADLIIEATGRIPNLSVLDDELGNVEHSSRGVAVNEFLQSISNPQVYAIGDCAATRFQLATVADEEGKVAAENILHGNKKTVDYSVVPSAVFTIPSIGAVGLTVEEAEKRGCKFRVKQGTTTGWPSSKRIGEVHSGYKILIDSDSDTILGAHLVRHDAAEVINTFALAIRFGIKASELSEFLWAYPTYTSDLKYMVR